MRRVIDVEESDERVEDGHETRRIAGLVRVLTSRQDQVELGLGRLEERVLEDHEVDIELEVGVGAPRVGHCADPRRIRDEMVCEGMGNEAPTYYRATGPMEGNRQ